MTNAAQDQQSSNPGQEPPMADLPPEDHARRTEQRAIDDQGGGTGLPAEARDSPVGTPIGGPAVGSGGTSGAGGPSSGSDPG